MASEQKKIPLLRYVKILFRMALRRFYWIWISFQTSLLNFYKGSWLEESVFFILFMFYRYSPKQFNPMFVKHNFSVLWSLGKQDGISATKRGKLKRLTSKEDKRGQWWKNFLTLGASQMRIEKVIFFTFLTLTLELYNPFDKKLLKAFLGRKVELIKRLLNKVNVINGKDWKGQQDVLFHAEIFERNSLLQYKVIHEMHLAVKRQKVPDIVKDAQVAMERGLYPILITRGCSGAYWIRSTKKEIAGLFKPFDEEIHAPNNPVGPRLQGAMGQRRTRRGCRVGESAHHEVAAFLVDSFFGFGIVPRTYYATFTHHAFFLVQEDRFQSRRVQKKKTGSFQEFLSGFVTIDDVSDEECAKIPLEEFQLLVVLDLILGNTDRNTGNILVGQEKLAAVDHGLCFPDSVDLYSNWYWARFDQGKQPLHPVFVELLQNFPYEELGWKLKKRCFISDKSLHRMKERIFLFIAGVDKGMAPEKLCDLLAPDYLFPLRDLDSSLSSASAEQVQLFVDAGMPRKKRK